MKPYRELLEMVKSFEGDFEDFYVHGFNRGARAIGVDMKKLVTLAKSISNETYAIRRAARKINSKAGVGLRKIPDPLNLAEDDESSSLEPPPP